MDSRAEMDREREDAARWRRHVAGHGHQTSRKGLDCCRVSAALMAAGDRARIEGELGAIRPGEFRRLKVNCVSYVVAEETADTVAKLRELCALIAEDGGGLPPRVAEQLRMQWSAEAMVVAAYKLGALEGYTGTEAKDATFRQVQEMLAEGAKVDAETCPACHSIGRRRRKRPGNYPYWCWNCKRYFGEAWADD